MAERESDRRKLVWVLDWQLRVKGIFDREQAAFLKKARPQLLALAQTARALERFGSDANALHRAEAQRLSAQFAQQ